MIPAPESVTRKFPVPVPPYFSENAPAPSVATVRLVVSTEILARRCPPLVAETNPENSETTGAGGGVGGGTGVSGEEGVLGDEEPHAEKRLQRRTSRTRRIRAVSIAGLRRASTFEALQCLQIRAIVFHVEHFGLTWRNRFSILLSHLLRFRHKLVIQPK